jgi:hypothetical protein
MREFVMTGITPDEWSKTFSDVDEGDVEWGDEADSDITEEDIVEAAKKFVEWLEDEKNFQN